ncbi:mediator of RNA polymerase II transcription subunit 25 [Tanacetum coccineum]|uniref:Mediator of RNA polymerase II transcription subunit 25 n=1 Tax=Tanacetum coccineum TaxID=301880 RepID=A0ABQ4ZQR6_9ASTR
MCPSPIENQTQQNEGLQRHCILVAASNPYPLPTHCILDAETVAKSFPQGKRNPSAADPTVEVVKNQYYLVLISENFREACAALCPLGVTNSPLNQTPEKSEPPPTSVSPVIDEESTGFTFIRLEESSREPNAKKSVNSELGFPVCSSKSENHQEPSCLLSMTVYSPSTLKRHKRPTSLCQKSSSSPLEGPKRLCTHETDVDNPHDMEPYTLVELKAIAKERRLKGYSKLKKSELLELLDY